MPAWGAHWLQPLLADPSPIPPASTCTCTHLLGFAGSCMLRPPESTTVDPLCSNVGTKDCAQLLKLRYQNDSKGFGLLWVLHVSIRAVNKV